MINKVFLPFGRSIPLSFVDSLASFPTGTTDYTLTKKRAAFPNLAGISPTRRKGKKDKRSDLTKKTSTG